MIPPGLRARHHVLMEARNEFQERVGVGGRTFGSVGPSSRWIPVLCEEGSRAGKVGGFLTEHRDGRIDATPQPPTVRLKASQSED